ncbi:DUF5696 domain-containing protein [Paenibacillus sp. CC-CFT747]|nr:DUF5696 domain-containing protein [Paenibacillus sp. CC-CFT747]
MSLKRKLLSWAGVTAITAGAILYGWLHSGGQNGALVPEAKAKVSIPSNLKPAVSTKGDLPNEADFQLIAESGTLRLYADPNTGHFKVEDKRDGHQLRSYPNPEEWARETITGTWRSHLRSPILLETVDLTRKAAKPEVKVNSLLSLNGGITDWKRIDGGFALTFVLPSIEMMVPVEVRLKDDYVETKVLDEGIEEGKDSLLNMKLYPFLGSAQPGEQEGYLLLPDGSGALYRFKENLTNDKTVFREAIYGSDMAFQSVFTNRQTIAMPVYGIKSGGSGVLAVADKGAEFGYIFAAPSGVYSRYAWATVEHDYRLQYFQPTSQDQKQGFQTYSKIRFDGDRSVRYYVLPGSQSDYAGMAAKYREYLLAEQGLKQPSGESSSLPLFVDLVGGDVEKGFLTNRYISGTTTEEAKKLVDRLHGQGIPKLVVTYKGWQSKGLSTLGFGTTMDGRLGGNEGMKSFAAYARSKGDSVLLEADYTLNNDNKGFKPKQQGMQNQAGTVLDFRNMRTDNSITLVSPLISQIKLKEALPKIAALGVNGLQLDGIGQTLFSDYNPRYRADRDKAAAIQSSMVEEAGSQLDMVTLLRGNAYAWKNTGAVRSLPNDYSYDLFMDEAVPFAQIVLHGVLPYTLNWGNTRDEYRKDFLRAIEYGAAPSFLVMNAKTEAMKKAFTVWQYSLNYEEWEKTIVEEYNRFASTLGDVQNQYITGHRTVAVNVKETAYAKGKRVLVNYNTTPVTVEGREIPAQDFIVIEGGGKG